MRHGPYLTLTAAFLFITVAIQVNAESTSEARHSAHAVNGASPWSWKCSYELLALSVLINAQEHLLKADGLEGAVWLKALECYQHSTLLLLCVTCRLLPSWSDSLDCGRLALFFCVSISVYFLSSRRRCQLSSMWAVSGFSSHFIRHSAQQAECWVDKTILTTSMFDLWFLQLVQSNFVLFCTYAADLRDHFQNIVLTILVSSVLMHLASTQTCLQRCTDLIRAPLLTGVKSLSKLKELL